MSDWQRRVGRSGRSAAPKFPPHPRNFRAEIVLYPRPGGLVLLGRRHRMDIMPLDRGVAFCYRNASSEQACIIKWWWSLPERSLRCHPASQEQAQ
ncbi:MAG TPA: hypothetical protein VH593_24770 [Ktedonobacteraceae bacterium]